MRQRMGKLPRPEGARAIAHRVALHTTSWHARRDLPRVPRVPARS
jgi:hypothetical protein